MRLLDRFRQKPADAEPVASPNKAMYGNPSVPSDQMHVDPFEEIGATGSVFLAGILTQDEYVPELSGERALHTYDRMYRSDGQIGAMFNVMILPLLQGVWFFEPASQKQEDIDIANHFQDNLIRGKGLRQTWAEHLEYVLRGMLRDGFSVEEKVLEHGPDGLLRYRKLAPRLSKTIYRVYPNQDDELDRVMQRVWRVSEDGLTGTYEYPVIPGSKLLWHTYRREGNNFFGMSMLRQAYKHWYYKDAMLKIAAVAAERMSAGVPVFSEPQNPTADARERATKVLQYIHAYQKTFVLEPYGWKFRFEVPNASKAMNLIPLVEYHDMMMVRSILAQFLQLDKGGSYAMMSDISAFFLQILHSIANLVCDVHNAQIVQPLADLNWSGLDDYPRLRCKEIDKRSIDQMLRGLAEMFAAGAITKTPSTENAIRSLLQLPDLDMGELAAIRAEVASGEPVDANGKPQMPQTISAITKPDLQPPYPRIQPGPTTGKSLDDPAVPVSGQPPAEDTATPSG